MAVETQEINPNAASILLTKIDEGIKTLQANGYAHVVETLLRDLASKRSAPTLSIADGRAAMAEGATAYNEAKLFEEWQNQPLSRQAMWRSGWLAEAVQFAHVKQSIKATFERSPEFLEALETAMGILQLDAEYTKIMSHRKHLNGTIRELEPLMESLQLIKSIRDLISKEGSHPHEWRADENLPAA